VSPRDHRQPRIAKGWYGLLTALILYFALAAADQALKRAPHPGYCPEAAKWLAWTPDLPALWFGTAQSDLAEALSEIPAWTHSAELAIRQATGIRPTALRCRVWLGPSLLIAGGGGRWGGCIHPGILLRVAPALNRLCGQPPEDQIYQYGDFYYAWRDGFLIVSRWPEYVQETLAAPPCEQAPGPVPAGGVRVMWQGALAGNLVAQAAAPQVTGSVLANLPVVQDYLQLPDAWPERPLLAVAGARWRDLRPAAAELLAGSGIADIWKHHIEPLLAVWNLGRLPKDWDLSQKEFAWALLGVDTSEVLPVPEMALVIRDPAARAHPWQDVTAGAPVIPFAWNDRAGCIMPVWGEKVSLCLAGEAPLWLAVSQEPLMDRLLGRIEPRPALGKSLSVRVDWPRMAAVAEILVRRASQYELLPGVNTRDVDRDWIPILRALARLGLLDLDAHMESGRLYFTAAVKPAEDYSP